MNKKAAKAKIAKPVRDWALVSENGNFIGTGSQHITIFSTRLDARNAQIVGERIARVLITEITK